MSIVHNDIICGQVCVCCARFYITQTDMYELYKMLYYARRYVSIVLDVILCGQYASTVEKLIKPGRYVSNVQNLRLYGQICVFCARYCIVGCMSIVPDVILSGQICVYCARC